MSKTMQDHQPEIATATQDAAVPSATPAPRPAQLATMAEQQLSSIRDRLRSVYIALADYRSSTAIAGEEDEPVGHLQSEVLHGLKTLDRVIRERRTTT